MGRDRFHGEAHMLYESQKWFEERKAKLETVGVQAEYDEVDNGCWTEPIAKIQTTYDKKLDRAANLMSENHSTFTLEVIARLKDFAEIGGRYSTEAAAVIKALSELDRARRVVELERKAQEHVNAARAAYEKACAIATYKPYLRNRPMKHYEREVFANVPRDYLQGTTRSNPTSRVHAHMESRGVLERKPATSHTWASQA